MYVRTFALIFTRRKELRQLTLASALFLMVGEASASQAWTAQYVGIELDCEAAVPCVYQPFNPVLDVETISGSDGDYSGVFGFGNDTTFNTLVSARLLDAFGDSNVTTGYTAHFSVSIKGGRVTAFSGDFISGYSDHSYTTIGYNTVRHIFSDAMTYRDGTATLVPAIPEPATYALFLAGLAGLGTAARRRTKA